MDDWNKLIKFIWSLYGVLLLEWCLDVGKAKIGINCKVKFIWSLYGVLLLEWCLDVGKAKIGINCKVENQEETRK